MAASGVRAPTRADPCPHLAGPHRVRIPRPPAGAHHPEATRDPAGGRRLRLRPAVPTDARVVDLLERAGLRPAGPCRPRRVAAARPHRHPVVHLGPRIGRVRLTETTRAVTCDSVT